MYYCSSMINEDLYGVTDTSDGVEEFFDKAQLYDIVAKYGLRVFGVTIKKWENLCKGSTGK